MIHHPELPPVTVNVIVPPPPPATTIRTAAVWALRIGLLASGIYTVF